MKGSHQQIQGTYLKGKSKAVGGEMGEARSWSSEVTNSAEDWNEGLQATEKFPWKKQDQIE